MELLEKETNEGDLDLKHVIFEYSGPRNCTEILQRASVKLLQTLAGLTLMYGTRVDLAP